MTTTDAPARNRGDAFISAAAVGARSTHPLATIPLTQVFYLIGILPALLLAGPVTEHFTSGQPDSAAAIAINILAFVLNPVLPYVVLWLWLRYYERRPFTSTGLSFGRRTPPGLGEGLLLALVFVGGWILVSLVAGTAQVDRLNDFTAGGGTVSVLLMGGLLLLMRIVMIGIEEQLFRGWMLQAVAVRWGRTAGVLLSSAFFALFHFFFIGKLLLPNETSSHEAHWVLVLNIFLWAVFAALLTLRSGNLWSAIAFHAAALVVPGFLLAVALPGAGTGGWPGTADAVGFVIVTIQEPGHYTGGAGFAGLFEGLPATGVLTVMAVGAWVWLRVSESRSARTGRSEGVRGTPG